MRDTWECAWRELIRRKGRTLTNVFGYALALGIPLTLVCLLAAARNAASTVLTSTGTHFIAFVPACGTPCYFDPTNRPEGEAFVGGGGVMTALLPPDAVDEVRRIATVKHAAPYLLYRFRDPLTGDLFTVGGFDPRDIAAVGTTSCAQTDLLQGRFLTPSDTGMVMVEEAYARQRGVKVGDAVVIGGRSFAVVAMINPGVRPAKADIYMLLPDAAAVIAPRVTVDIRNQLNIVLVEVKSSTLQNPTMRAVKQALPGSVISTYACYKPASEVIRINERAVWLLTVVVALFAVALAMKSQLASVVERRRDIGILKALGWTDGSVVAQILAESLLQALTGGVLGSLAAAVFLAVAPVTAWSSGPALAGLVQRPVIPLGLALTALAGALAGSVPAAVAARQRPTVTLHAC
jgi:putative ABC transport system permease protein